MNALKIDNLKKNYGDLTAVDNLSFTVNSGEFFSILGPSGCGKTTTLRCITGFEEITDGTIRSNGKLINSVDPSKRDINMVFQGFALFPHKTIEQNIGFGLKLHNIPASERTEQVNEMLEIVGLSGMGDRMPDELSGGQQQRVALARALILQPSILALDEPLASLDRKLREEMRYELKRLQQELDVTTIYVTHDQKEALALSDRMLIMNEGSIEQIGTPHEIYDQPKTRFVAEFIGESNILCASDVTPSGLPSKLQTNSGRKQILTDGTGSLQTSKELVLRPEDVDITSPDEGYITGKIKTTTYHGNTEIHVITTDLTEFKVETRSSKLNDEFSKGDVVGLVWNADDIHTISQ